MERGGGGNPRFPEVWNDESSMKLCELSDSSQLGQPATTSDIWLEYVHPSALEPFLAFMDRGGHLGTAHARLTSRGQLRMSH